MKYGEIKIKKEIKKLFDKPINVCIDDMDNFEEKEMTKKGTLEKNTCYNWLFNYNPEPCISPPPWKKKKVCSVKDKIMSLFKTKMINII